MAAEKMSYAEAWEKGREDGYDTGNETDDVSEHQKERPDRGKNLHRKVHFNFGQCDIIWDIFERNWVPINAVNTMFRFDFEVKDDTLWMTIEQPTEFQQYRINKTRIIEFRDREDKRRYLIVNEVKISKPDLRRLKRAQNTQ